MGQLGAWGKPITGFSSDGCRALVGGEGRWVCSDGQQLRTGEGVWPVEFPTPSTLINSSCEPQVTGSWVPL